eukprot:1322358-Amorphochlora_amoeboformis.AAC.2
MPRKRMASKFPAATNGESIFSALARSGFRPQYGLTNLVFALARTLDDILHSFLQTRDVTHTSSKSAKKLRTIVAVCSIRSPGFGCLSERTRILLALGDIVALLEGACLLRGFIAYAFQSLKGAPRRAACNRLGYTNETQQTSLGI